MTETDTSVWRWIDEAEPRDDALANMALDAAMAESVRDGLMPPSIRLYSWRRPIVTVGRLQDFDDARRTFGDTPLVRRQTGGKAVLHDGDLTVSVAAPEANLVWPGSPRGVLASYRVIVSGITAALEGAGIVVSAGSDRRTERSSEPNCFSISARCDLQDALTKAKLLGSAQLRQRGIILQQMSLRPLVGVDIHGLAFKDALKRNMALALRVSAWRDESLSAMEESVAFDRMRTWEVSP
jgi:lipoate-protein ligase A